MIETKKARRVKNEIRDNKKSLNDEALLVTLREIKELLAKNTIIMKKINKTKV